MTKQHLMLFQLMMINNVVLSEKSVEFECDNIFLDPKKGGAIIRGAAIFGRNTVKIKNYIGAFKLWSQMRAGLRTGWSHVASFPEC